MELGDSTIIRHYDYTYIIRYRYSEEDNSRIGYYCNNTYDFYPTDSELEGFFNIEDGDEIKILGQVANDFNNDEILSDAVIFLIKGTSTLNEEEYIDECLGYIKFISETLYSEERECYKSEVMKSVLLFMGDLRKQCAIVESTIKRLFKLFGIERDENISIRKQIEQIANPKADNEILLKLAEPQDIRLLRRHLDWMGRLFNIKEEKSRYMVGVVFLLFSERCKLLLPTVRYNMTKCFGLLADYFGIEPPTYRQNDLRTYEIEVKGGRRKKLYDVVLGRNGDFWQAIK